MKSSGKVCVDGTFVAAPTHSFSKLLSAEGETKISSVKLFDELHLKVLSFLVTEKLAVA